MMTLKAAIDSFWIHPLRITVMLSCCKRKAAIGPLRTVCGWKQMIDCTFLHMSSRVINQAISLRRRDCEWCPRSWMSSLSSQNSWMKSMTRSCMWDRWESNNCSQTSVWSKLSSSDRNARTKTSMNKGYGPFTTLAS